MFKNYLKIAFRNLVRHKGFTAIVLGGLATGIACCLLIFVYIQDELSYDTFHRNAEQIYRVTFSTNDEGTPTNANGSFGVGPALKNDFSAVQEFTRLRKAGNRGSQSLVRYRDKSFYEKRFFFADSTVFDVFSYPLLKGNPETALARPNTVSAYAAEQRIKEVGVRKVLGASISSIVILFTKDFMKLVVVGIATAVPVAYYFASNWLESFAYKIDIGIQPFVLAGCALILIALATIILIP